MLDLTDFSQIPQEYFKKPEPKPATPITSKTVNIVMAPVDPALISPELREAQEREERKPESIKKNHWSINDFDGVPFNAADAERMRKERGISETAVDDAIRKSEHLE